MYMSIHVYVYVSIVYMVCSPTLEEIKNISIYISIYLSIIYIWLKSISLLLNLPQFILVSMFLHI